LAIEGEKQRDKSIGREGVKKGARRQEGRKRERIGRTSRTWGKMQGRAVERKEKGKQYAQSLAMSTETTRP
jgi:hypothetical protein